MIPVLEMGKLRPGWWSNWPSVLSPASCLSAINKQHPATWSIPEALDWCDLLRPAKHPCQRQLPPHVICTVIKNQFSGGREVPIVTVCNLLLSLIYYPLSPGSSGMETSAKPFPYFQLNAVVDRSHSPGPKPDQLPLPLHAAPAPQAALQSV